MLDGTGELTVVEEKTSLSFTALDEAIRIEEFFDDSSLLQRERMKVAVRCQYHSGDKVNYIATYLAKRGVVRRAEVHQIKWSVEGKV